MTEQDTKREDDRFGDPEVSSSNPPESGPPREGELSAELRALPRADLYKASESLMAVAMSKTKSKRLSEEVCSDVWLKVMTTRRWNPARGPLLPWLILVVKSELSNRYTSKAPEREASAHEGFYQEVLPAHTPSAEEAILDDAEAARRQANAAHELNLLSVSVAGYALAPGVMRCMEEGIDRPRHIAQALGVPVTKVYDVLEALKRHLKKMRASVGEHDANVNDDDASEKA